MAKKRQARILTDEQRKYINTLPSNYRNVMEKAMKGISPAAGIKAKCLDCCCWQRSESANCGVPDCPLYPYNPYRIRRSKLAATRVASNSKRSIEASI